jgi:uncharacterized protein
MSDVKALFAMAEVDDSDGLAEALRGSEGHRVRNANGETLLLFSLYRGRLKCIETLGALGPLTLQEAAAIGDVARTETCVRAAPWSLHSLSADGWPALHLAAFFGRDAVVTKLLELGADARQWARAAESNLAIHAAAAGQRIGRGAFKNLIAATGDPDVLQKQGYTALMIAAANGFAEGVEVLSGAGADHGKKLADGRSAADIATERGHQALADRLR